MGCETCPLQGRPRVEGAGAKGGLAVVGEAPGQNEARQGLPFIGLSGQLLRQTLDGSGIPSDELYITNSCLCHPYKNETPSDEAIAACRDRLIAELREVAPKKVLTVGGVALAALLPDQQISITKARGRWWWLEDVGCYMLPTYHPAAILREPDRFHDFAGDIALLAKMPTEYIPPAPPPKYTLVDTPAKLRRMVRDIYAIDPPHVSLDLETTGFDEFWDPIVCMGIAASETDLWVVNHTALANSFVRDNLKALFEDKNLVWAGQNGNQFDAKFLRVQMNADCYFRFDTMLAHYTLDERQAGHDLKTQARLFFQAESYANEIRSIGFERFLALFPERAAELADKYRAANPPTAQSEAARERQRLKVETFIGELLAPIQQHELETLWQYQAEDAMYTWMLVPALSEKMDDEEVSHVHSRILVPASRAVGIMEGIGAKIDIPYLKDLDVQFTHDAEALLMKFREEYDLPDFNPNSPVQVKELLIDRLHLLRKGQSTDAETLANIDHPAVKGILELRQKTKVQGTYIRGLLDRVYPDERIRASFNLFGTRTGRLSSSDPNLQNIPQLMGPVIRKAFIPTDDDWVMFEADYSQLELRIAAYFSRDPKLIQVYIDGGDIHTLVASEVFNVPYDEVTYEQRYVAKYIDFGILYGRQAPSLAYGELKCSVKQAQQYIDNFLGRFPHLRRWMTNTSTQALKDGFVRSAMGRKRRFPLILDSNAGDVQRQAVNTPIQSTASDLCLTALTRIVERADLRVGRPVLTVHDSILCEAKRSYLEEMLGLVKYEMEENIPLKDSPVPFKVEIGVGPRWGETKQDPEKFFNHAD